MQLVHGHWYTTSLDVPGAHKTPEGRSVCLYQKGRFAVVPGFKPEKPEDGPEVPEGREFVAEHVVFIRPCGQDVMKVAPCGNQLERVTLEPRQLPDIEPLIEADHIPRPHRYEPGAKTVEGQKHLDRLAAAAAQAQATQA